MRKCESVTLLQQQQQYIVWQQLYGVSPAGQTAFRSTLSPAGRLKTRDRKLRDHIGPYITLTRVPRPLPWHNIRESLPPPLLRPSACPSVCLSHASSSIENSAYWRVTIEQRGWLGSRVVSVLDSGAEGPGFKSQPRRCPVTVLGKLFTPIVPLFAKQRNW